MYMHLTQETLGLIKAALADPRAADDLIKAITTGTGLVWYDLEPAAKKLYPVLTPLRNMIPRVPGDGGTATHWKAVTGINTGQLSIGVSEGRRGGIIAIATLERVAAYRGIGLENAVSFEAEYAAKNFEDVKAMAVQQTLESTMIGEEATLWGGNGSSGLGTTPTPVVSASDTGGSLAAGTWSVICVALTHDGFRRSSVAGGIPGQLTRTNADSTTDTYGGGNAKKSTAATGTVSSGVTAGKLTCSVAPVPGAAGYAWFWGAAGSELLGAITTINSVVAAAAAAGTQSPTTVAAADYSANSLVFDGLISQIAASGSGAYVAAQATGTAGTGTPLTSDGAGGIAEFETAFAAFWDNYKLSPDLIWMSATELLAANKIIIANGGAPLIRFNLDAQSPGTIDAGAVIGSYLNKITNKKVEIRVHPDAVQGTIVFYSRGIPYPLSNVTNILQVKCRREYYQIEWPLRTRQYEYGVYADEVLQMYFPPAFGVLYNIGLS